MESVIVSKNQEQAVEILSGQLLFEELVELAPNQYPKGMPSARRGRSAVSTTAAAATTMA
jgi:hypothetical protein